MNEVKHAIQTIKSRMDEAEKRICELETATLKFSSARRTKKKEWIKVKKAFVIYDMPSKETICHFWNSRKEGEENIKFI